MIKVNGNDVEFVEGETVAALLKRMMTTLGKLPYRVLVNIGDYGDDYADFALPANMTTASWYPQPSVIEQCDAVIQEPGKPNRSTIPPKARRAAMINAYHRCETPGCGRTRFLEVHHRRPRSQGGGNEPANLQVLCSACHQLVHRQGCSQPALHRQEGTG